MHMLGLALYPGSLGRLFLNVRVSIGRYAPVTLLQTAGADLPYPSKKVVDVIKKLRYNKIGAAFNLCL